VSSRCRAEAREGRRRLGGTFGHFNQKEKERKIDINIASGRRRLATPIVVDEAINGRVLEGVSLEKMVFVCGIYSTALSLYLLLSYFSSSSRTFNILERMHLRANQHTVWIPMETLETVELVKDGGGGGYRAYYAAVGFSVKAGWLPCYLA
jgi:hypothetical protein